MSPRFQAFFEGNFRAEDGLTAPEKRIWRKALEQLTPEREDWWPDWLSGHLIKENPGWVVLPDKAYRGVGIGPPDPPREPTGGSGPFYELLTQQRLSMLIVTRPVNPDNLMEVVNAEMGEQTNLTERCVNEHSGVKVAAIKLCEYADQDAYSNFWQSLFYLNRGWGPWDGPVLPVLSRIICYEEADQVELGEGVLPGGLPGPMDGARDFTLEISR